MFFHMSAPGTPYPGRNPYMRREKMLTITLYKSTAEPERVNKTSYLNDALELSGDFRESINKMTGSVLIRYNGNLNGYNYLGIPELGRYYFITEQTIERNGFHRLDLKTDVLYSNKTDILATEAIIARNQTEFDTRLIDDRLKFHALKVVNTIPFPISVRSNDCFILAVNGG